MLVTFVTPGGYFEFLVATIVVRAPSWRQGYGIIFCDIIGWTWTGDFSLRVQNIIIRRVVLFWTWARLFGFINRLGIGWIVSRIFLASFSVFFVRVVIVFGWFFERNHFWIKIKFLKIFKIFDKFFFRLKKINAYLCSFGLFFSFLIFFSFLAFFSDFVFVGSSSSLLASRDNASFFSSLIGSLFSVLTSVSTGFSSSGFTDFSNSPRFAAAVFSEIQKFLEKNA